MSRVERMILASALMAAAMAASTLFTAWTGHDLQLLFGFLAGGAAVAIVERSGRR